MRVLLFGMIAGRAGTDCLELVAADTAELKALLAARVEGLNELSYALAVNRVIVSGEVSLSGDEEIAVLPPFAGG